MKYFEKFPTIQYPYYGKLVDNPNTTLVEFVQTIDMHVRFKLRSAYTGRGGVFYTHRLEEGDTPDKLAHFYYGIAIVTGKQIGRASCRERVLRLV